MSLRERAESNLNELKGLLSSKEPDEKIVEWLIKLRVEATLDGMELFLRGIEEDGKSVE